MKEKFIKAIMKIWFFSKIIVAGVVVFMSGTFYGQMFQPLPFAVIYSPDMHFERAYGSNEDNEALNKLNRFYEKELL